MLRLRCRGPKGAFVLSQESGLTTTSTIEELKMFIFSQTDILPHLQQLKLGFPPKLISCSDDMILSSIPIHNGDQIIVEAKADVDSLLSALPKNQPQQESRSPNYFPVAEREEVARGMPESLMEAVLTLDGFMVVREMEDDNSCLFRSIGYVLERNVFLKDKLRQMVAQKLSQDPVHFPDAFLDRPRKEYINWITKSTSWGGAIELSVLSMELQVEICSIDVETCRVDKFGEGQYEERVFVMYSGIHYDAVALTPQVGADPDFDVTKFPVSNSKVLQAAVELANVLKKKKKFTNVEKFDLRCGVCGVGLVGQSQAQAHAKQTGHVSFTEY